MAEELLTTSDVMKLLGLPRMTVTRLVHRGVLRPLPVNPALERPKAYYFRRAEVERVRRLLEQRHAKAPVFDYSQETGAQGVSMVAESRNEYHVTAS